MILKQLLREIRWNRNCHFTQNQDRQEIFQLSRLLMHGKKSWLRNEWQTPFILLSFVLNRINWNDRQVWECWKMNFANPWHSFITLTFYLMWYSWIKIHRLGACEVYVWAVFVFFSSVLDDNFELEGGQVIMQYYLIRACIFFFIRRRILWPFCY